MSNSASDQKKYLALCIQAFRRENWLEEEIAKYVSAFREGGLVASCEVALFEADAQIGHLLGLGHYDVGLCQDQDITQYGAPRLAFKLGYKRWGYARNECDFYDASKWSGQIGPCDKQACTQCGCAIGLDQSQLLQACVLAGTDYSSGLPNVGLKTACKLMKQHGNIHAVLADAKNLTPDLKSEILFAVSTFLFHYV